MLSSCPLVLLNLDMKRLSSSFVFSCSLDFVIIDNSIGFTLSSFILLISPVTWTCYLNWYLHVIHRFLECGTCVLWRRVLLSSCPGFVKFDCLGEDQFSTPQMSKPFLSIYKHCLTSPSRLCVSCCLFRRLMFIYLQVF